MISHTGMFILVCAAANEAPNAKMVYFSDVGLGVVFFWGCWLGRVSVRCFISRGI